MNVTINYMTIPNKEILEYLKAKLEKEIKHIIWKVKNTITEDHNTLAKHFNNVRET